MKSNANTDTIAAIATPPGKGGVGVIRISGQAALSIVQQITSKTPKPRLATYSHFNSDDGMLIDSGLVLYFKAPNSFTGEEVIELQGHGGPVVQDLLLQQIIRYGARQAQPGEFSERAFLNDKIDLTQAEAIADLIDSTTAQAAKGAMRSLQGDFSKQVHQLLEQLIHLRMYVEAAIDFPEEDIDFLADQKIIDSIEQLQTKIQQTLDQANQGVILRSGVNIVLAGKPNAGKSSLLNALSGYAAAIVTDVPGTTRDTVKEVIDIDGLPVHITDTAGLRNSDDAVEKIGIQRAQQAIQQADHIIYLLDAEEQQQISPVDFFAQQGINNVPSQKVSVVINKIDLLDNKAPISKEGITVSATRGDGIQALKDHLKQVAGFNIDSESTFTARRRHITALETAQVAVDTGFKQLQAHQAGELLAAELLQAQNALNEITGAFSADDLLGEIFRGFCIGK